MSSSPAMAAIILQETSKKEYTQRYHEYLEHPEVEERHA